MQASADRLRRKITTATRARRTGHSSLDTAAQARDEKASANPRATLATFPPASPPLRRLRRSTRRVCPTAASMRATAPRERCTRNAPRATVKQIWTPTVRLHSFTSGRFHVLLNSLFKVLFNFPSRYLFAIGLEVVFSLSRCLPAALGCNLKQPDSSDRSNSRSSARTGLSPSMEGHIHVDLDTATASMTNP